MKKNNIANDHCKQLDYLSIWIRFIQNDLNVTVHYKLYLLYFFLSLLRAHDQTLSIISHWEQNTSKKWKKYPKRMDKIKMIQLEWWLFVGVLLLKSSLNCSPLKSIAILTIDYYAVVGADVRRKSKTNTKFAHLAIVFILIDVICVCPSIQVHLKHGVISNTAAHCYSNLKSKATLSHHSIYNMYL